MGSMRAALMAGNMPLTIPTSMRITVAIKRRCGQPAFRNALIAVYGGRCAVTGCDAADALEAAHIRRYAGARTNHSTNGLLLRADLHTLFDLGLVAVDTSTMTLMLASRLRGTSYESLHGKAVRLPEDFQHHPSREKLDQPFVRGVCFDIGQCFLRIAISKRVRHAFLTGRNILAPENVEQFD